MAASTRKVWITANVGPALLAWLLVIMPAVIAAQESDKDVWTAYLLAASQSLALDPLLGLSQAVVLRNSRERLRVVTRTSGASGREADVITRTSDTDSNGMNTKS